MRGCSNGEHMRCLCASGQLAGRAVPRVTGVTGPIAVPARAAGAPISVIPFVVIDFHIIALERASG